MKAQLSYDFYFSLIVFVIFVSSLFFRLITLLPFYSDEVNVQRLRSEAYQISQILINDAGHPGNWHTDMPNAKRLGLADETANKTNLISRAKAKAFNGLCNSAPDDSDYKKVIELMDIKDGFLLQLTDKSSAPAQSVALCSPQEVSVKTRVNITRIVAFDDGAFAELSINVWDK